MSQYWAMKTFTEWWETFSDTGVIGIDQEGVDSDYGKLSDAQIEKLLSNSTLNDKYTEYKDRMFREFSRWMQIGDLVIIGTGKATTFSLVGVARVTGNYYFGKQFEPRHLRPVKFLVKPSTPRPMQRFLRTSRLELIHETDFQESILSLLA